MAYRPPSQTRYAGVTAPPPPGPFSSRSSRPTSVQDNDGWITPASRRPKYSEPVAKPASATTPAPAKSLDEEYPTLGVTPTLPKKTWGSSESMAERMKKKMQEEEEERAYQEMEKLRKEQEKESPQHGVLVQTNIISHQGLMRRLREDERDLYEEEEVYEPGLNDNGYGYEYDYAEGVEAHTPDYPYEGNDYTDDYNDDYN